MRPQRLDQGAGERWHAAHSACMQGTRGMLQLITLKEHRSDGLSVPTSCWRTWMYRPGMQHHAAPGMHEADRSLCMPHISRAAQHQSKQSQARSAAAPHPSAALVQSCLESPPGRCWPPPPAPRACSGCAGPPPACSCTTAVVQLGAPARLVLVALQLHDVGVLHLLQHCHLIQHCVWVAWGSAGHRLDHGRAQAGVSGDGPCWG
jgi:hypothetical protein